MPGESTTTQMTGGCFCGEIRYEISGPPQIQLVCFCRDCLATTGTDGYSGVMVNEQDFRITAGKPAAHVRTSKSGRTVKRRFCATCGTNLWGETEIGLISVAAGTLDDPDAFAPSRVAFAEDAPAWARVPGDRMAFSAARAFRARVGARARSSGDTVRSAAASP